MPTNRFNRYDAGQFLLFIIWPFLALVSSIKNRNSPWAKNIFWLFCIFYGFTFVMSGIDSDAYRYMKAFEELSESDYTIFQFLPQLYSSESSYVDILYPFISFFVSRVTGDSRILMAIFALIFGFFYSRNLWYLFKKLKPNIILSIMLFIIGFALLIPIWKVGAFRFNTAIHIFIYGALPFIIDGDKKKLWVIFLSVFVHFSFALPIIILLLYIFFGNRLWFYFTLFLISLIVSQIDLESVKAITDLLPGIYQSKSNQYLTEDMAKNSLEGIKATNWYIQYYIEIIKWLVSSFLIVFFINKHSIFHKNDSNYKLFCFVLLFYTFANIANLLPQGVRFYGIANLLAYFLIISIVQNRKSSSFLLILRRLAVIPLAIIIIVDIRKGFDYTGLSSILGNPIIAPFITGDIPLIDILKSK